MAKQKMTKQKMTKQKAAKQKLAAPCNTQTAYAHQRGEIKNNALKALVTDPLFKNRIERNKKGKGSYQRNAKHRQNLAKGESPFKSVSKETFLNGLFSFIARRTTER